MTQDSVLMQPQEALGLLRGWFNNKMMVVIFKIQSPQIYLKKAQVDSSETVIFLKDLRKHFLTRLNISSKDSDRAARWLIAFFKIYPKNLNEQRLKKAWLKVQLIYEGLGIVFSHQGGRN